MRQMVHTLQLSICAGLLLLASAGLAAAQDTLDFLDQDGAPTSEIVEGAVVRARLVSAAANSSPTHQDMLYGQISSQSAGDTEDAIFFETGPDTGVFLFEMRHAVSAVGSSYNNVLQTVPHLSVQDPVDAVSLSASGLTANAVPVGADARFQNVYGGAVDHFAAGEPVALRILVPAANTSSAVDVTSATVTSSAGDFETVQLTETAADSGVFLGQLPAAVGGITIEDGALTEVATGSYQLTYTSPGNADPVSASAQVAGSSVRLVDGRSRAVNEVLEGSEVSVRVFDLTANIDPSGREITQVILDSALTGDSEILTLVETGNARAIFAGKIELATGSAIPGNGILETGQLAGPPHTFDTLTASHSDAFGTVTATVHTLGSRVDFLDPYGRPSERVLEGLPTVVRVEDHDADLPGQIDTTSAELSVANNGDLETLILTETANGRFEGSLPILFRNPATPGDGVLESFGDPAFVSHDEALGSSASDATADIQPGRNDVLDAWGQPTGTVLLDGVARVRGYSWGNNVDPATIDTLWLMVDLADSLQLQETGPDTGVFEGDYFLDGPTLGQTIEFSGTGGSVTVEVASAQVAFIDLLDQPVDAYAVGATVRFAVASRVADADPAAIESLQITLENSALGQSVVLDATETAADSGLFIAEVATFVDPPVGGGIVLVGGTGDPLRGAYDVGGEIATTVPYLDHAVPVTSDDVATTEEAMPVTIAVLLNDADPEGHSLSLAAAGQGANGTTAIQPDGSVLYTPDAGFFGVDTFTYVADDGAGGQARGLATVTVNESVVPPVLVDDAFTVTEDTPVVLDVLANDSISGPWLDLGVSTVPSFGTLQQQPDNTFIYTPDADFSGSDSFVYIVFNPAGYGVATVHLTVLPVNDPPVAGFVAFPQTTGNVPLLVNLLAEHYSTDVDDGIATFEWDFGDGNSGDGSSATGASTSHLYTAAGVYTATLTVTDFAGASDTESVTITVVEPLRDALLVVANAAQLGPGDVAVRDRLLASNYQVTLKSQGAAQSGDASGMDVVLISSTVTSSQVTSKFRDVTVPVLTWEPFVLDDMQMTGPVAHTDYGSLVGQTEIAIVDPAAALAAGLSAEVSVISSPDRLVWGRPATTAHVVASLAGDPSRATIFAYEAGAPMVGLDAPARRLGFFLNDATAATLTAEGWSLFDAALCWSVNCTGAPVARFTATPAQGIGTLTAHFDASTSAGDAYPIASYSWDFGDGESASGGMVSHTYDTVGTYVATLTVTDQAGLTATASATLTVSASPPAYQALLVAPGTVLGAADQAVRARLESLGFGIQVVAASTTSAQDAVGKDLVVISSTVNSGQVGTKFTASTVPVLTWEAWLYDDLGMTGPGTNVGYGRIDDQAHIVITDAAHPLAAGLSGLVAVVPGTTPLRWGAPAASAQVVAVAEGNAAQALVFAYEAGAAMVGQTAPARRVGLPFYDENPSQFTAESWALFDAAVSWAIGN